MTKDVEIGGQVIQLRATASLPIAYRLIFRRDLLRDMEAYFKKLSALRQDAGTPSDKPNADAETPNDNAKTVSDSANDNAETVSDNANDNAEGADNSEILYADVVLITRLAYCMAKSANPSIPKTMEAWLDTIDDPNAPYLLTGEVLQLYSAGFQTVAEAKKNIPPQTAP